MPGDDRRHAIARVYAEAIFRLAEGRGEAERLLEELEAFARFGVEHPDTAAPLLSPLTDTLERRATLERLFRGQTSDLFVDSLLVLNARGRLALFADVASAYREAFQRARHVLDVHVTSAVPLVESQRARLRELTRALTGNDARLLEKVEPELLGGLVVRARDRKFDTTLRNKLDRIRTRLSARASHEIIQARGQAT